MDIAYTNGALIKKIREELDLTQRDFADHLGVSQTNIWRYENRLHNAPFNIIRKIMKLSRNKYELDDFYQLD